jgi:hypothetical protein
MVSTASFLPIPGMLRYFFNVFFYLKNDIYKQKTKFYITVLLHTKKKITVPLAPICGN